MAILKNEPPASSPCSGDDRASRLVQIIRSGRALAIGRNRAGLGSGWRGGPSTEQNRRRAERRARG